MPTGQHSGKRGPKPNEETHERVQTTLPPRVKAWYARLGKGAIQETLLERYRRETGEMQQEKVAAERALIAD